MNYNNEENNFKNNLGVIPPNFLHLYVMMAEYNKLNKEQKKKYMNILTEWSMREKDILNLNLDKD